MVVRRRMASGVRKSLEETWQHLESRGEKTPRGPDGRPFAPDPMPGYDDEEPGFFNFQCRLEDAENSNLTLPRTFFGNVFFVRVSFADTELSESRMFLTWDGGDLPIRDPV